MQFPDQYVMVNEIECFLEIEQDHPYGGPVTIRGVRPSMSHAY